jgi:hypothetical protein
MAYTWAMQLKQYAMAKYSKKAQDKIEEVMHGFKEVKVGTEMNRINKIEDKRISGGAILPKTRV